MFNTIDKCRAPIITCVQGAIYGGGLGLLAVSDFVIAEDSAKFCFSELKLGLIPATISPFIMRKIGYSAANALFLSASVLPCAKRYIDLLFCLQNILNSLATA